MKAFLLPIALLTALALFSGCASRTLPTGGKETSILGGAVTVASDSFQPINPATVDTDTSKIIGKSGPSGKKISLFWGTITFHDY